MNDDASHVKASKRRRVGVMGGRDVPGTGAPLSANSVRSPKRSRPDMGIAATPLAAALSGIVPPSASIRRDSGFSVAIQEPLEIMVSDIIVPNFTKRAISFTRFGSYVNFVRVFTAFT